MAETLSLPRTADRALLYQSLIPQIRTLVADETDLTANLANIAAALKQGLGFFWVGFYLVKADQLVLGPFQGPVACTRIAFNRGVCGACYTQRKVIRVPDVEQFPGHIACSSEAKSEIVLPAFKNGDVFLVLDVDSDRLNDFSEVDEQALREVMRLTEELI
ncbi:MAG: GAF domain-containing protein [Ferruginibacter sp.]|nr:GAF domain-containing protein [Cytophagales bacterium]